MPLPVQASAASPAETPLRMLVLASSAMPLADIDGATVKAGLLKDLGERIAHEAGMPLKMIVTPRNRVVQVLEQEQADIYCDTLPEWLPEPQRQQLFWSAPVNWNPQVLVSAAPRPAPASWQQLRGSTLLSLLGYEYPKPAELARGFADHSWKRSDALSEDVMLRRLILGRGDYGIIGKLALNWFLKNNPQAHFNIGLTVVNEPTRCAVTKRADFPATKLLRAIKHLADDGELQRIPQAYLPKS